jgi:hypothetical protein
MPAYETIFRSRGDGGDYPREIFPIENEVIIAIGPDEISELEKGIALLKKCNKFWQCVANRGLPGKAKHCYLPRNLP